MSNARENPSLHYVRHCGITPNLREPNRVLILGALAPLLEPTGPFTPGPSTLVHRCVRPPRWVWSAWTPRSRGGFNSMHSFFPSYSLIVITVPSWTTASTGPIAAGVHDTLWTVGRAPHSLFRTFIFQATALYLFVLVYVHTEFSSTRCYHSRGQELFGHRSWLIVLGF